MLSPKDLVEGLQIICIDASKQKIDPYVMEGELYTIKNIYPPEEGAPHWCITVNELQELSIKNDEYIWTYRIERFSLPIKPVVIKKLETVAM